MEIILYLLIGLAYSAMAVMHALGEPSGEKRAKPPESFDRMTPEPPSPVLQMAQAVPTEQNL